MRTFRSPASAHISDWSPRIILSLLSFITALRRNGFEKLCSAALVLMVKIQLNKNGFYFPGPQMLGTGGTLLYLEV